MWVKVTTSGPRVQADLDSLTVALAAKWAARLGTLPGSQYAGNLCSTEWQTGVATTLQSAASTVDVPSANSGINDAAACVLFVWITGERYRGGHPRTYLAGPQDTHVTNGSFIDTSYGSSCQITAAAFLTDVNALTFGAIASVSLGTVHFVGGGAYLATPTFAPYHSVKVNSRIATQRRRIRA